MSSSSNKGLSISSSSASAPSGNVKSGFVKPGSKAKLAGISEDTLKRAFNPVNDFYVENNSIFSLNDIRIESERVIAAYAQEHALNVNLVVSAICSIVCSQGTARQKVESAMTFYVENFDSNLKKTTSYLGDGVFNIVPIFSSIRTYSTSQYSGIKLTENTANGGKLFTRCYANEIYAYIFSLGNGFANSLKIAQKTGLPPCKRAVLCSAAFSDLPTLSKKDAMAHLKIMANYMKRSRAGKSKADVNNNPVDRKSIFISLASRIYSVHYELGGLNNDEVDKIWEKGELPSESDVDLESEFYYEGKKTKLNNVYAAKMKGLTMEED